MQKTLSHKLERLRRDPDADVFILADAKDADMAHGLAAPGKSPETHNREATYRTLQDYRDLIRQNTRQALVDIMLMSASTNEVLTLREKLFEASPVTPAIRANDTTDIWLAKGGIYGSEPSRPFRTASLDHAMCGRARCEDGQPRPGADLGLYSITFNNDVRLDHAALEQYNAFRAEAEAKGFRHFLEVFAPNAPSHPVADVGRYLNDMIVRTLAGVTGEARPVFLKIPYNGPEAMEALAGYDRSLIVGILGGAAGTTFDAFSQLAEAKKHGARVALYGRMINSSEDQPLFIRHLRAVADGQMKPEEAVRSYHGGLEKNGIKPYRLLRDDLARSDRASAYSGNGDSGSQANPAVSPSPAADSHTRSRADSFDRMTPAEKVRWNLDRWSRILD